MKTAFRLFRGLPAMAPFFVFAVSACAGPQKATTPVAAPGNVAVEGRLLALAFQQRAAEYRALCLQAFQLARLRVEASLQRPALRPRAVVTDIDETVLDNSPYDVALALQGKEYDEASWNEWTARASADTVPGAPAFLKFAAAKGIEIFYITNRSEKERRGTLANLQLFGLPQADNEHLLLKGSASSKESRRQAVLSGHEVVLYLGDNLSDFSALFDKKSTDERLRNTDSLAAEFGDRFIVLPNPVYGDWESAFYHYRYDLTPAQKDSAIKSVLKGY
ncbi:5'-nucleotidase, lipoprotein e(P4) family [Paraflavisolibacter sp. H34]|uniref:5'-nucleotidase, lipoprotein e(P4) family n=1 Tax=Huijunlia imazamoxiresistens TaxID=3127457 RepID=UPI00301AE056